MPTKNYDLLYCCLNFSMPTKSGGRFMNRDSFYENVYNSEQFRKSMESDQIMGLLTHKGRYYNQLDPKIPYADNIILNEYWANILKDIDIKGDEVLVYLKLTNHKGGIGVRNILKEGTPLGVSMSTFCSGAQTGDYYIQTLLGVDHTMDPAFLGTHLVHKNFSESMEGSYVNFSNNPGMDPRLQIVNFHNQGIIVENRLDVKKMWNIPFDVIGYERVKNIPEYFSTINSYEKYIFDKSNLRPISPEYTIITDIAAKGQENFSLLKQLIIESAYPPQRRLQRRVEELIREIKSKPSDYIEKNKEIYYSYINTPIYEWISKAFNSDKKILLAIGLRLGRFTKNPSKIMAADRELERIKAKRRSAGNLFDRQAQKKLDSVLRDLFAEIWKYIEERANVTIVSGDTTAAILKTFSGIGNMNFKTVDEWLDAGTDGQKDYMIWADSFPYNAKDINDYLKSKVYYGYTEIDKLIDMIANKQISEKDKKRLVDIMKESNVQNFDNGQHKNFNDSSINDVQPMSEEEAKKNITDRTLTDVDINLIMDKILENPDGLDIIANKLAEKGLMNVGGDQGQDPNAAPQDPNAMPQQGMPEGDPNAMPPIPEGQPPQQQAPQEQVPPQNQPAPESQEPEIPVPQPQANGGQEPPAPPQNNLPNAVNDSQYAKPKVISKSQAQSLMNFNELNVEDLLNFSNIDALPMSIKRKLICFSVVEMIDANNISPADVALLNFAIGTPNGVSEKCISDLLTIKCQFSNGVISENEYENFKQSLMSELIS